MTTLDFSNRGLTAIEDVFDSDEYLAVEPRQLRSLHLQFNRLGGSIKSVTHPTLAWLEALSLANNDIRVLPTRFPPMLRRLDISHNFVICLGPLSACRYLISLNASHNAVTVLPSSLGAMSDLASLDVSDNGIGGFDGALNKLKRLHTLRCQNNELHEIQDVLEQCAALPELRYLHLSGNPCVSGSRVSQHEAVARRRAIIAACSAGLRSLDGVAVEPIASSSPDNRSRSRSPQQATDALLMMRSQSSNNALRPRAENTSNNNSTNNSSSGNASCAPPSGSNSSISAHSHALAAQQMRDERRRCQTLRDMLAKEMQREATLKASNEHVSRQIKQEQALQRTQLGSLAQLRRETELARLEVERLKTDIAEEQLLFLEMHAESRERRVACVVDE
jgi:hypothetical protein